MKYRGIKELEPGDVFQLSRSRDKHEIYIFRGVQRTLPNHLFELDIESWVTGEAWTELLDSGTVVVTDFAEDLYEES